jgi:hypothetical protein
VRLLQTLRDEAAPTSPGRSDFNPI